MTDSETRQQILLATIKLLGTKGYANMSMTDIVAESGISTGGIYWHFKNKDAIIEAVHHSEIWGSGFAYFCVTAGVLVTSFYSFRLLYMTFHGKPRMDKHTEEHLKESPLVVTIPLILLAIPSVVIGAIYIEPMLFGNFFGDSIKVAAEHDVLGELKQGWHGIGPFVAHALQFSLPFVLMLLGWVGAWLLYSRFTHLPEKIAQRAGLIYRTLENKYWIDEIYFTVFAKGARALGRVLWKIGDVRFIDGLIVNGSAWVVGRVSAWIRTIQSGYVYHYAFAMIIGVLMLLVMGLFV